MLQYIYTLYASGTQVRFCFIKNNICTERTLSNRHFKLANNKIFGNTLPKKGHKLFKT